LGTEHRFSGICQCKGAACSIHALVIAVVAVLILVSGVKAYAQTRGADWLGAASALGIEGFERPAGDWRLELPLDHGLHPAAGTEAWQMVAHLTDTNAVPLGVQFSLFRLGVLPPESPATERFEPRNLYRGHMILTDGAANVARAEERFGRGLAGLAGFDEANHELKLDDWSIDFAPDDGEPRWQLRASVGDTRLDLTLRPAKVPLSVDGEDVPFQGYTFSRLDVDGTLETEDGAREVSGDAWFEHLWGELPVPGGSPVASDRLQVQFDDDTELAVIRSRRLDGRGSPTVEAFLIDADGRTIPLGGGAAEVDVTREWRGAEASWPVAWQVRLDEFEFSVTPVMDGQEHAFASPTWSGLVRVAGQRGDQELAGMGTLQLSGYAAP
jgi:predicted secreted hydrolase